jgi:hypothetical protein
MATVDTLPADQRAVLGLVLQRGRSYDQIATMLAIERSAVQDRALAALEALGPATDLTAAQRAELSDYLLGQLPEQAAEQERFRLAGSDAQQRWARAVAIELASLSSAPLAAIPRPEARPSSRPGGAVLLAFVAVFAVALVVVVVLGGSGSTKKQLASAPTPARKTTATNGSTTTASTTPTSTTTPDVVAQVNLLSPDPAHPSAVGVAQIVRVGNKTGIVIVAQGMPANPSNEYYAVWLSNAPTDSQLLGFLPQRVTSSGKLEADSVLQPGAARYSKLLVTLESQRKPTQPGTIVLQGAFKLSG